MRERANQRGANPPHRCRIQGKLAGRSANAVGAEELHLFLEGCEAHVDGLRRDACDVGVGDRVDVNGQRVLARRRAP